jgi:membrane peptidoglycan carboxypeptidase
MLNAIGISSGVDMAKKMGVTSLAEPSNYGLAFALGAAEVQPLELATAYGVLANEGKLVHPTPILKVTDGQGNVLEDNSGPAPSEQIISPGTAYIISDILSDAGARVPAFGTRNYLTLSRRAAAKTGTTSDCRDNWTAGYVPGLVTVVWVGNNNGDPLRDSVGSTGAARLWNLFMERSFALLNIAPGWYTKPLEANWSRDLYLTSSSQPNKYIK